MKIEKLRRRAQAQRRRRAFRMLLLALPALFWSTVFAWLAGVRLPAEVADVLTDAAQSLIALACLVLIVMRLTESTFFEMPESVDIVFGERGNQA